MMAQIEWYEEILALEPGSKVFFPFAKRLESEGLREKALNVLRQGLIQHPEYLEARVLLAHLLQASGDTETASAEAGAVFARLCDYPDFWVAAGTAQLAQSARHPAAEDVTLLLTMLAENARCPGQSFVHLLRGACGPVQAQHSEMPSVASEENAREDMKTAAVAVEKAAEKAAEEALVEAATIVEDATPPAAVEIAEKVTAELTVRSASELPDTVDTDDPVDTPLPDAPAPQSQQNDPLAPVSMPSETIDGIPVTAAEVIIHAVEQELFDRPVDEEQQSELSTSGTGEKLTEEEFSLLIAEKIIQASDRKEGHPDELLDLPDDMGPDCEPDGVVNDLTAEMGMDAGSEVEMPVLDADATAVGDAEIFDSLEATEATEASASLEFSESTESSEFNASTGTNDVAADVVELTEIADSAEDELPAELAEDPLVSIDSENMDDLLAALPEPLPKPLIDPLETVDEATATDPLAEEAGVDGEPEAVQHDAENAEETAPATVVPELIAAQDMKSGAEGLEAQELDAEGLMESASAPDFEVELTEVVEELAHELNHGVSHELPSEKTHEQTRDLTQKVAADLPDEASDDGSAESSESSEDFDDEPVQTRSMAEVLAEQGDIAGALAIYSELLRSAQPEEAQMLKQRMTALSGEQQAENNQQTTNAIPKTEKTDKNARADTAGLRKMLENLAGRLEKRARS